MYLNMKMIEQEYNRGKKEEDKTPVNCTNLFDIQQAKKYCNPNSCVLKNLEPQFFSMAQAAPAIQEVVELVLSAAAIKTAYGVVPHNKDRIKLMLQRIKKVALYGEEIFAVEINNKVIPLGLMGCLQHKITISSAGVKELDDLYIPHKAIVELLEKNTVYRIGNKLCWRIGATIPYFSDIFIRPLGKPIPPMEFAYKDRIFVGVPNLTLPRTIKINSIEELFKIRGEK